MSEQRSDDAADAVTPKSRSRFTRRSLLIGVPVAAVAVTGLILRGDPPDAAVVDDSADREAKANDLLTPWGELPPEARIGSGVAVARSGEVLLLHRGGAPFAADQTMTVDPVIALDPRTGKPLRSWGRGGFKSPHGISVDLSGAVWVTDVMTNQVTIHDSDGRLIRKIGHDYHTGLDTCLSIRNTLTNLPCTSDPYIFARPTDVAVTADGDAYVSDGYRNSRVAHLDSASRFVNQWGELGNTDGAFTIPHGITALRDGALAIADRRNARVQVFGPDGSHRATYSSAAIGRPYDVATGPDGTLFVLDGGDFLDEDNGQRRGYVLALRSDGSVSRRWALADQNADPHQLAVGSDGTIYVAALNGPPLWRWSPNAS